MYYILDNEDPEDVACSAALTEQLAQLDKTAQELDVSPCRLMVAMFKVANSKEWFESIVNDMTTECHQPTRH